MAIPGSVVGIGKLVTPGGAAGPLGPPGPSVVSSDAGNVATLGSDAKIFVPDPTPTIWSARLRSYNSISNPNFEVDQRNIYAALTHPAGLTTQFQCDRWQISKNTATGVVGGQDYVSSSGLLIPGTNFCISRSFLSIGVNTAQANLASGEYLYVNQFVEGPSWRELSKDVHSVSLLCWCSVALNFAISIRDSPATQSLVIPCSIPANTVTLLSFPNLPIFPSSGNFNMSPGVIGYTFAVCLGTGTTYQTSTTGSWVSGNYLGYSGMANFLANNGAQFQLRFIQHEPGPCSTLMDKPFTQNLDECLRYYQKSYNYGSAAGTVIGSVFNGLIPTGQPSYVIGFQGFLKPMAKVPAVVIYDNNNGAANSMYNNSISAHPAVTTVSVGDKGISFVQLGTAQTAGHWMTGHYTADTGW